MQARASRGGGLKSLSRLSSSALPICRPTAPGWPSPGLQSPWLHKKLTAQQSAGFRCDLWSLELHKEWHSALGMSLQEGPAQIWLVGGGEGGWEAPPA